MKLKELMGPWVIFTAPNKYRHPYPQECHEACSFYMGSNQPFKARGNVRNRFSHIVSVCRKYNIPMYYYGNNDAGYAYWQQGFALPAECINQNVIDDLSLYIDYLDYVAVVDDYLSRTNNVGAFISVGVRWLKHNSGKLHKRYWNFDYIRDSRAYDKCRIVYSNKYQL